jgi:HEAT repeats
MANESFGFVTRVGGNMFSERGPMPSFAGFGIVLIVVGTFSTAALGYLGKRLDLQTLVAQSDLIAVVDVSKVDDVGPATALVKGGSLAAGRDKVEGITKWCIKGGCPDQLTMNFVSTTTFAGYERVPVGTQIVFLKQHGIEYEFTDASFPSLPAVSGSTNIAESNPLLAVIAELGAVLSSPAANDDQKWLVLAQAVGIPDVDSFTHSLHSAEMFAGSPDLKYGIEAELISRGDLSALRSFVDLLLGNTLTDAQRETLQLAVANNVKTVKAAPILSRLLQARDASSRRAAALALWRNANPSAIPDLVGILQDPDWEVRFYAVRALSDIVNEPDWGGPGERQFREREQEYLAHWRNWAKSQGVAGR